VTPSATGVESRNQEYLNSDWALCAESELLLFHHHGPPDTSVGPVCLVVSKLRAYIIRFRSSEGLVSPATLLSKTGYSNSRPYLTDDLPIQL
jgi:hypothetical protein